MSPTEKIDKQIAELQKQYSMAIKHIHKIEEKIVNLRQKRYAENGKCYSL